MKKEYIKPEQIIVALSSKTILTGGSPDAVLGKGNVNAASIESRRGSSVWDDEEE